MSRNWNILVIVAASLTAAALACNAPTTTDDVEPIPTATESESSEQPTPTDEAGVVEATTPPVGVPPTRTGTLPSRAAQGGNPAAEQNGTSALPPGSGPPTTTPTFDPNLPVWRGPNNASFELFRDTLVENLTAGPRDYGELQTLMGGDVFLITGVDIAEREVSPAEARQQLEEGILPVRNTFSYTFGDDANIPLLLGYDPRDTYPEAVYFLVTGGWLDGNADAILVVEPDSGSGYRWSGIILDSDGFEDQ